MRRISLAAVALAFGIGPCLDVMAAQVEKLPASGKAFDAEQSHWFRLTDGKIAEHWATRDDLTTMLQLGSFADPGSRSSSGSRAGPWHSDGGGLTAPPANPATRVSQPVGLRPFDPTPVSLAGPSRVRSLRR